jgi:hypothetical protein
MVLLSCSGTGGGINAKLANEALGTTAFGRQKCSFSANWISRCGSTVEVITPVAPGPSVI